MPANDTQTVIVHAFCDVTDPGRGDYDNIEALRAGIVSPPEVVFDKKAVILNSELEGKIKDASNNPDQPYLFMLVGKEGADELQKASQTSELPSHITFLWSGHQLTDEVRTLVKDKKIQLVSVASTAVSHADRIRLENAKVNYTLGVPATLDENAVVAAYKKEAARLPEVSTPEMRNVLIFLGGDAADIDNKNEPICFTEAQAKEIAQQLAKKYPGTTHRFIITNYPRTGQYDPETKEETFSHDIYDRTTGAKRTNDDTLDKTSQGFKDGLIASGTKEEQITFFHFQWGTQKLLPEAKKNQSEDVAPNSMFNPLMGLAWQDKDAIVIIPGESVTDLVKCTAFHKTRDHIFVLKTPSMNSGHKKFLEQLLTLGYYGSIEMKNGVLEVTTAKKHAERPPDSPLNTTQKAVDGINSLLPEIFLNQSELSARIS